MGKKIVDFSFIGKEVEGVEPSKVLNKIHTDFGLRSTVGFLDDVNKRYDLVILSHVLEHLTNLDDVMGKLSNIVGKYLFIEVPGHVENMQSIQNAHNFYFSINTLNHFVLRNGFRLIKADYVVDVEYILALYERDDSSNKSFKFNYDGERRLIIHLYRRYIKRYFILKPLTLIKIHTLVFFLIGRVKKLIIKGK